MIEPAVSDVVGPAIAAHDPNRAPNEKVGKRKKIGGFVAAHRRKLLLQGRDPLALDPEVRFRDLRCAEQRVDEILADLRRELARKQPGELGLLVDRQPITEPEFRVVFEQ